MTTAEYIVRLKNQTSISRSDIAELLASVAPPGEKRDDKLAAMDEVDAQNRQGHSISLTAESYGEF